MQHTLAFFQQIVTQLLKDEQESARSQFYTFKQFVL